MYDSPKTTVSATPPSDPVVAAVFAELSTRLLALRKTIDVVFGPFSIVGVAENCGSKKDQIAPFSLQSLYDGIRSVELAVFPSLAPLDSIPQNEEETLREILGLLLLCPSTSLLVEDVIPGFTSVAFSRWILQLNSHRDSDQFSAFLFILSVRLFHSFILSSRAKECAFSRRNRRAVSRCLERWMKSFKKRMTSLESTHRPPHHQLLSTYQLGYHIALLIQSLTISFTHL